MLCGSATNNAPWKVGETEAQRGYVGLPTNDKPDNAEARYPLGVFRSEVLRGRVGSIGAREVGSIGRDQVGNIGVEAVGRIGEG